MSDKLDELIDIVKTHDDWQERRYAIISLSYEKNEEIYPVLLNSLKDPISEVRHAAVIALGRYGNPNAVQELLRPKILASTDVNIRWAAVSALGKLGDHRIIEHLINLAEDNEWLVSNEAITVLKAKVGEISKKRDTKHARILIRMMNIDYPDIVTLAVEGLCNLGSPVVPILIDGLDSVWAKVRCQLCRTLGLIGDVRAVPHLIKRLENDTDADVRAEAATALGKLHDVRAIQPLINAMDDFNEYVRDCIVAALVKFSIVATEPLMIALGHSKNKYAMCSAIEALGEISDERAIPILSQYLCSSYYLVRMTSITALSKFGPQVIDTLIVFLSFNKSDISNLIEDAQNADDFQTRIRAIRALGDLEDHRSATLLKSFLSDQDREITLAAQEALVKIGCAAWRRTGALIILSGVQDERVLPFVHDMLSDDSIHVRHEAVQTLGKLKDEHAIAPLTKVAQEDPEHEVRKVALSVLRELASGSEALLNLAITAATDESIDVRLEATRILGDFKDERVVAPLLIRLADSSWSVRFSAENSLCAQGKSVVPYLVIVIKDGSVPAKRRALRALGRISDTSVIQNMELAYSKESDKRTKEIALETLKQLRGETGRKTQL